MKEISIYTDGSCLSNPGAGGWAWIKIDGENITQKSGGEAQTTNNIMELSAVINALESLKSPCKIKLFSDSQYVVRAINEWLAGWVKCNFKDKKNVPLWKKYLEVSKMHEISAIWVKAHAGDKYNEMCDELAKNEAMKFQLMKKDEKINHSDFAEEKSEFLIIEEKLNYFFKDKELLQKALTHKSAGKNHNERLEFLGDAVLDLVVADFLYRDYKKYSEGDLSKIRAALVNEKSFAKIAEFLQIGKFLKMSASEEHNGGASKPSLLSDAFEAMIGAIYLESGYLVAQKVSEAVIFRVFTQIDAQIIKDYKTKLQELTQAKMAQTPEYRILSTSGPDHKKEFEVGLFLDGKLYANECGRSKKEAEQKCAKIVLERLQSE